ncbi:hypothetical protein [Micromonospora matsumotoense]|uniref:hypothetical protein n=1 Tax=Micromonospora matsumotoense TaxID=121616 RepID=UPI0033DF8FE5
MTQPKTNRIPAPLYAAAGAGELAFQQLRKLPTVVSELGNRVVADGTKVAAEWGGRAVVTGVELRQKATETFRTANLTATGLRDKATPAELNLDKLRAELNLEKLRAELDLEKLRTELDLDLDKLRGAATRNAAVVLAGAQAAQERALAAYGALIARGERVVGAGVLEAAETVNADIEATDATIPAGAQAVATQDRTPTPADVAQVAPDHTPTPADVAEVVEAKPAAAKVTRTRVTKATTKPDATKPAAAKPAASKAAAKPVATDPAAKQPKTTKRTRPAAE